MEPLDADHSEVECSSFQSMYRRTLIRSASAATGIGLFSGWTDVAEAIARAEESHSLKGDAKSLIFLWMQGGPSQLEQGHRNLKTALGELQAGQNNTKPERERPKTGTRARLLDTSHAPDESITGKITVVDV